MEERHEPRYPVKNTATLRVLSGTDLGAFLTVILDISRSGLRAECGQFLPHGSRVAIETNELTVIGTVQNCSEIRSGLFGVGIGISDVTPHRISSERSP